MAQKPLKGVNNVLGGLLSDRTPDPDRTPVAEPPQVRGRAEPETAPSALTSGEMAVSREELKAKPSPKPRAAARRGRPPGQKAGEPVLREKVTLRLSAELMAEYRDWSWEERCQLGELVERALTQYQKPRQRKARAE